VRSVGSDFDRSRRQEGIVRTSSPRGDIDRDGWLDLITGASNDTNGRAVSIVYNLGQTFDMAPPDYLQSVPISLTDLFFTDMNRDGISDFTLLYYRSIPMGSELKTIGAIQSFVEQPDRTLLGTGESLVQGNRRARRDRRH
jgi:hypothetical protein